MQTDIPVTHFQVSLGCTFRQETRFYTVALKAPGVLQSDSISANSLIQPHQLDWDVIFSGFDCH